MTSFKPLSERIDQQTIHTVIKAGDNRKEILEGLVDIYADHLIALADAGVLRPYDAMPNRRMNLIHSWNIMANTEQDSGQRRIEARHVADRLFPSFLYMRLAMLVDRLEREGANDPDSMQAMIAGELDAGDVRWWTLSGQDHDFVSGQDFAFELRGWNLLIGIRPETRGSDALVPAADLPAPALQTLEIEIPSGDLLVADWFRAEGFTETVDEGQPWRGGSVLEDEADAERYVRDYGFLSARSSRRSLLVITDGSRISVGAHDEDGDHPLPSGWHAVGSVLIDLRKISVVDRTILSSILGRTHASEKAEELAEEVAKGTDTVRLKVSPGRYRATSSGRGYLEDLLPEGHPLKTPGYEPVLILEKI